MGGRTFGARLRNARLHRQLTQDDVARASGLKQSAVSHFECDRRTPSIHNLTALCHAIRVSSDELLGLDKLSAHTSQHGASTTSHGPGTSSPHGVVSDEPREGDRGGGPDQGGR